MSYKVKHLEMIQEVVKRLSTNSFYIKAWTISLITLLATLAEKSSTEQITIVNAIIILFFWYLDSYYLFKERSYRKLFDVVRTLSEEQIDFSMDTRQVEVKYKSHFYAFFSKTLLSYYPLIVVIVAILSSRN